MLVFENGLFSDIKSANAEATRARRLADDLDRLIGCDVLDQHRLAQSPYLDRWTVLGARRPALHGIALRPRERETISILKTSPIIVAAAAHGWILCADGFYQLGGIEDGQHFSWNEPSQPLREWR